MIAGMTIYQIAWYFLIYSFLGWVVEVVFHAVHQGRIVNRGFLNGPVCPVYGFGVLAILSFFGRIEEAVGSGSGILALSAMLLGARAAVGVDIDEKAVKTAKENAARNGFGADKIRFLQGDLTEKVSGSYNLITANIVADVIVVLCEDITSFMSEGGLLIVSGIIEASEAQVKAAFAKNGLRILERYHKQGWLSFVLEKAV